MAYKHQILQRYQNENSIHSIQSFDEMLRNTMQEKFCNLEFYIQRLKSEIHLRNLLQQRLCKIEQKFLTIKTGIHFLMRDLERLTNLRRARSHKKSSEVKEIEQLFQINSLPLKKKKKIKFIEENSTVKKKSKNYVKTDTNLLSSLDGNFWTSKQKLRKTRRHYL